MDDTTKAMFPGVKKKTFKQAKVDAVLVGPSGRMRNSC
jgi:hypothetical protein